MKRLYRCYACKADNGMPGKDFVSDVPVCSCGIDGKNPRLAHLIVTRELIHFEPPFDHPELRHTMGIGHVACNPELKTGINGERVRASGEPRAVNCPLCQETTAYKLKLASEDGRGVIPEKDPIIVGVAASGSLELKNETTVAAENPKPPMEG